MSRIFVVVVLVCATGASLCGAEPVRKAFGIEQRELWTTGNIHGSPEPPDPYRSEDAFPRLKFMEPLSAALVPGQNQFAVATRPGRIHTFEIRPDVDRTNMLIELKRMVYGIAFHPRFAENGYFFVTTIDNKPDTATGNRLLRFRVRDPQQLVADPASEELILAWPSGGHDGGCIRFGPDGYLYLSTGDASGIADELKTGQKIDDLPGSILRIDVDHPSDGRLYSIPADNPFAGRADARGEIWSFGHRQVWKFSFDKPSGRLWAGDVGQDLWEMVYLIRRGGNYGWSVQEGAHPFRPERPRGPGDFEKPVVEHPHSDFRSITGGYVYRSDRLPELKGAYIYGDYDTGRVWMLRFEGGADAASGKVVEHRELATTQVRLVEFAQDNAGEVYLVASAGCRAAANGDGRISAQAERDGAVCLDEGSHSGQGVDSVFRERAAVVGWSGEGAVFGAAGRFTDRAGRGRLSAWANLSGSRLAVSGRHGAGEDFFSADARGRCSEPEAAGNADPAASQNAGQ